MWMSKLVMAGLPVAALCGLTFPGTAAAQAQEAKLRVIAFGAHPDDCDGKFGGTAAKFVKAGAAVKFVSVTNGDAGHQEMAPFGSGPGIERQKQRRRERHHRDGEAAPAGPVEAMPPPREDFGVHQSGTRVESIISRRIASTCADFFCVVA